MIEPVTVFVFAELNTSVGEYNGEKSSTDEKNLIKIFNVLLIQLVS